jgi:NADH-quinone oxidoreductase subunit N
VNASAYVLLAPLLTLAGGVLLLMLQIALRRQSALTRALSVMVYGICVLASIGAAGGPALQITPLLMADSLALLLCAAFSLSAAVTALLSAKTIAAQSDQPDEYYLLLMLATLGACVLVYANHVASLLLGLELLAVSLYALIAYPSRQQRPAEAATKYLLLSGAATAIMLFGFALLYAATGALTFSGIGAGLGSTSLVGPMPLFAAGMVLVGLGFKLAAAPMHLWTPDVYEGAPSPVSGFLASVAKTAAFIVLLRFFILAELYRFPALTEVTALLAVLSMVMGNLLALLQNNIKRMLAYSSIAHIGYLMIIFSAAADPQNRALASEAAVFYLIAYLPTVLAAFGVVTLLKSEMNTDSDVDLESLSGLFWRQPLLAVLMMVSMLSLAGIPLTAGFIGKLYIFSTAVAGEHWVLLALLLIGTTLGIYYYLRVVYQMTVSTSSPASGGADTSAAPMAGNLPLSFTTRVVAVILLTAILALGLLPQTLMHYLKEMF